MKINGKNIRYEINMQMLISVGGYKIHVDIRYINDVNDIDQYKYIYINIIKKCRV